VSEDRAHKDMEFLSARPEFRRFLFRVIQTSGLFHRTTDGSDGRNLDYHEGRRNLGLEILDMAESGQPIPHAHGDGPFLSIIQALVEESQQPTEKPNARRKFDRNSEIDPDAD
jgi:hypothetical protein